MITITCEPFGTTKDGIAVKRYWMKNDSGMCVGILSYGCAIQSICVPDKDGGSRDVVLGYDTLSDYENGTVFFGAFVGRVANRIKNASFTLNGKTYELQKNDGNNHLHGIYSHKAFDGEIDGDAVVFRYLSPAFDEGYPGSLRLEIRYRLREDNALSIAYTATTDASTVINLTNHSYFNLNGQDGSDVLSHELMIDADRFTEVDEVPLPTGRILLAADTPLDFRVMKPIGRDIDADDAQIRRCGGYDHNFALNGEGLRRFAKAVSYGSGITLEAYTTQPGVQLYSGNFIQTDRVQKGKNGLRYPRYGGFCLETQHYPCSPNYAHFPTTQLNPGETYHEETIYKFSTIE